jgi:hypothetical protein
MNTKLSKIHIRNVRALKRANVQITRCLNQSIREDNKYLREASLKTLVILLVSLLEASLDALLTSTQQVSETMRIDRVYKQHSEIERYRCVIHHFFCKHYNKNKVAPLTELKIGRTNYARYEMLNNLLNNEISTLLNLRNRFAHGQWVIALNENKSQPQNNITGLINRLDKNTIVVMKNAITSFVKIIRDLVVSLPTFERDFDKHCKIIDKVKHDLINYDLELHIIKRKNRWRGSNPQGALT